MLSVERRVHDSRAGGVPVALASHEVLLAFVVGRSQFGAQEHLGDPFAHPQVRGRVGVQAVWQRLGLVRPEELALLDVVQCRVRTDADDLGSESTDKVGTSSETAV